MTVTAEVENTGSRSGDEVAQLYLRPAPVSSTRLIASDQPMPRLILAGFQRVTLAPHTRQTVQFTLTQDQLLLMNAQGQRTLQPHDWQVTVGGSQPEISATGQAKGGVSQTLHVN